MILKNCQIIFKGEKKVINKYIKEFVYRLRGEYTTEKLIKMGMTVGKNFKRLNGVILDPAHCWLISIGDNVTIAPRVHILAHDASTKHFLNYTKIGRVDIGDNVFIGSDSIILPNVTKDIPAGSVIYGNPAKFVSSTADYIEKNKKLMENSPVFGDEFTLRNNITEKNKIKMVRDLKNRIGFVD